MLRLTVTTPSDLTDAATGILNDCEAVSTLSISRGAALRPVGDVLHANVAREAADAVIELLRDLGVHERGSVEIDPVPTWISRPGYDADIATPGSSADAVVWPQVAHRSYEDTELNWVFLSFMTLATLIASVAIVIDSQILTIGAMVLGPEFGAIAALGLALVRRPTAVARRRRQGARRRIRCRDRGDDGLRAGPSRSRLGDRRDPGRPPPRHRLHLQPEQVVVHRGRSRGGSRGALGHLRANRRTQRGVHLGHDDSGRRQRGSRAGFRANGGRFAEAASSCSSTWSGWASPAGGSWPCNALYGRGFPCRARVWRRV